MADPIADCLAGLISPPVAVARLLLAGLDAAAIRTAVAHARAPSETWHALHAILHGRDAALDALAAELRTAIPAHAALHDLLHDPGAPGRTAAFFDRAAAAWPEAGVALYSLNDPALLAAATAEIAAWLHARALLRPGMDVLDLGCGTGRMLPTLAATARSVLALDVSPGMVAQARARHPLPNVRIDQTDGQALPSLPNASLDLILAVDSVPYIVAAGPDVLHRHLQAAARALRPRGHLAILNFSYRADPAADAADARSTPPLLLLEPPSHPFHLWDAPAFILRRPP